MKIIRLDISNDRKVRAFKLELDGDNLHVAGDVSSGKTTVVNAFWDLLEKRGDFVTHGEKKGWIRIKVGEGKKFFLAERITTAKTSTVNIFDQDGEKVTLKDFKQMISDLSVNPHKIAQLNGPEQIRTLLKAAKVGVDLDSIDKEISDLEGKRLETYRDMERLKPGPEPEYVEKVSVSGLIEELDAARKNNIRILSGKERLNVLNSQIEANEAEIEELKQRIAKLQEQNDSMFNEAAKGKRVLSQLSEIDTDSITEQIQNAEEINASASEYELWFQKNKEHKDLTAIHSAFDAKIKAKREEKKEALDSAEWPIDGLSIDDGKVLYNGCLLENLGESEQMLVCAALAMNDIKAHPLKVVRMDGIESMSREHFERLVDMFNAEDIQVLSTRVTEDELRPMEIKIVDGVYEQSNSDGGDSW